MGDLSPPTRGNRKKISLFVLMSNKHTGSDVFFQFFNRCGGIEKNLKKFGPPRKSLIDAPASYLSKRYLCNTDSAPTYNNYNRAYITKNFPHIIQPISRIIKPLYLIILYTLVKSRSSVQIVTKSCKKFKIANSNVHHDCDNTLNFFMPFMLLANPYLPLAIHLNAEPFLNYCPLRCT